MRKIKILDDGFGLEKGMVYNAVIRPFYNTYLIEIVDEYGKLSQYFYPGIYFEDVTAEYRKSIINDILK